MEESEKVNNRILIEHCIKAHCPLHSYDQLPYSGMYHLLEAHIIFPLLNRRDREGDEVL